MAYTVHNVRHLFVVNSFEADFATAFPPAAGDTAGILTPTAGDAGTLGNIVEVTSANGNYFGDAFIFQYVNVLGEIMKSDYFSTNPNHIRYATSTAVLPWTPRVDTITGNGTPIVGQSYILRIIFREWGSGSPEDQRIVEVGAYIAQSGDTYETIFNAIAELGERTLARLGRNYLSFAVTGTGNAAQLVVTEIQQPFIAGKRQGRPLNYFIQFVPITSGTGLPNSYIWGTDVITGGNPGSGTYRQAADYEWFYMGERADTYRGSGYPYNWDTAYMVAAGHCYAQVNIGFYFRDDHVFPQASEKQLHLLIDAGTDDTAPDYTLANSVIAALNAALPADKQIPTL